MNLGWSELLGLEAGKYRFILAPRSELYDLERDSQETVNRIDSQPGIARQLKRRLEELAQSLTPEETEARTERLDPETEARLRSLGYISASAPRRLRSGEPAVDPKNKLSLWEQIQSAIWDFSQRNYALVIESLRNVLASDQDILIAYAYLGSSYMKLEKWSEAEATYRQALARGMESADFHLNLGLFHSHRGKTREALRELEIAIALDPLHVVARYHLANLYRRREQSEKAIEHYRAALAINPRYVYAWNGLGMTLARAGRDEEALASFQKVVELDPEGAQGYFNLAVALERLKRPEEALGAYRSFLRYAAQSDFSQEKERAREAIRRLENALRKEKPR